MRPKATKGACVYCGTEYTKAGMAKHLAKCLTDKVQSSQGKSSSCFHLQVTAKYSPVYWLHLQVDSAATLKALDAFLRGIWLECCGHMSMFRSRYIGEVAMSRKLSAIMQVGAELDYDYDMGDTTSLQIKVLGEYQGLVTKKKPVVILARNLPPEIACDECGNNPAVKICPECNWEGEGWLCKACAAKHACGEVKYMLPVANSPRAGVCGYAG